jgi:hypothetical protein
MRPLIPVSRFSARGYDNGLSVATPKNKDLEYPDIFWEFTILFFSDAGL